MMSNKGGRRILCVAVVAGALVATVIIPAAAAPGDLDPTFSGDGRLSTDFFSTMDVGAGMALQSDGKIVVVGNAGNDFGLVRYKPGGTLDTSFGRAGRMITDFNGALDQAAAVAVLPNGKIIVAGSASTGVQFDFALARYSATGFPDRTFAGGGKTTTDFFGGHDIATGLAVLPNGKILVAGLARNGSFFDFGLARYTAQGHLDPMFGAGGRVTTDFSGHDDGVAGVAVLADGRILAAGWKVDDTGHEDFALARYKPGGTLDRTFGTEGKVITDFSGSSSEASGLALQSDGRIVVAGLDFGPTGRDFALARYKPGGALDPTFGTGGKVLTDFFGDDDTPYALAIQPDGRIVVVGSVTNGYSDFGLARYQPDGALDPTFGTGGTLSTNFYRSSDGARAVALQPDGKIAVAGWTLKGPDQDFALARYVAT